MTAFEQGYADFLKGREVDDNPYDFDECPYSFKRWKAGWLACKAKRAEVLK